MGAISSIFASQTTLTPNLSFGILSGGVFSTISKQYEKSIDEEDITENIVDQTVAIKVQAKPGQVCRGGRCWTPSSGCNGRSCGVPHDDDHHCNGKANCGTSSSSTSSGASLDAQADAIVISATSSGDSSSSSSCHGKANCGENWTTTTTTTTNNPNFSIE